MQTLTSELQQGDVVEMTSGGSRDIGRRFLVLDVLGYDSLHMTFANKAGRADRRCTPWTGWYGDCRWRIVKRNGSFANVRQN